MTFNSLEFLIFFPVVASLYFILPHKVRWILLLAASCVFYMAFVPAYILILAIVILVDYTTAIRIDRASGSAKRWWLVVSIISTCLVLFVFKYFDFFNANLDALARFLHWNYSGKALGLLLPLGLSFHTFQGLSYVIEVYWGKQKPERHFGIYALYVMFFPQLVAGPIERPQHMLPQFREVHRFDYDNATQGLKLMLWGMFKKVVIADQLAALVNPIFNSVHSYSGVILIEATLAFAIQIYSDFSAYTDIARGAARVMGFRLVENFNAPYLATSISNFWRRWHISLSSWFRDYVYIPLGGNRVSLLRWCFIIAFVFLLSGLWHGANWTFVIWGSFHGICIILSRFTKRLRGAIVAMIPMNALSLHALHAFRIATTFFLVCTGWIFFRAHNVADGWYMLTHALRNPVGLYVSFLGNRVTGMVLEVIVNAPLVIMVPLVSFVIVVLRDAWRNPGRRRSIYDSFMNSHSLPVRWLAYLALLWSIFFFGAIAQHYEFIYFAF